MRLDMIGAESFKTTACVDGMVGMYIEELRELAYNGKNAARRRRRRGGCGNMLKTP
jgi:hypothetical protein